MAGQEETGQEETGQRGGCGVGVTVSGYDTYVMRTRYSMERKVEDDGMQ